MNTDKWLNNHIHTEYTNCSTGFLDCMNKLDDLIDRAIELNYAGITITDHECLSAHMHAEQYLDKLKEKEKLPEGFKLIRGNEGYIAKDDMSSSTYVSGDKFYHIIYLALDEIGYNQIRELSNRAWNRSFFRAIQRRWNTMTDLEEVIGKNPGHVVGTTACLGGVIGTYWSSGKIDQIDSFLSYFESIFGKDYFFIELAPYLPGTDQDKYNQFLYRYKNKYRYLISTDAHYIKKEDFEIFKVFLNSKSTKDREVEDFYSTAYMWSWEEIKESFKSWDNNFIEQCRLNSIEIYDKVQEFSLKAPLTIPKVPMEDKKPNLKLDAAKYDAIEKYINSEYLDDRFLVYKIFENYDSLIDHNKLTDEEVYSRINEELTELWLVSETLGQRVSSYLTTMSKMIDIIWNDADTIVGVSRGSAGAWITNYLLGITQINPLLYPIPIYPWRFIHRSRPDMPDVDFDTPGADKQEVIQALTNYFESIGGSVTQVAAYGTEASRSALRTTARGLGIDDEVAAYATSLLAAKRGFFPTLEQAYSGSEEFEQVPEFKMLMDSYPKWKAAAWKIEGLVTSLGAHAAGIMVRNDKIEDKYAIMKTTRGIKVTSNDLHSSEVMGLIKFDCLSVDALGKIKNCLNYLLQDGIIEWQGSLKETYKRYLWPSDLHYGKEFWDNINENNINNLFQLNTQVGRSGLALVKPDRIEQAGIINSLIRLQPQSKDDPMPIETYRRYKDDIGLWYKEMQDYCLSSEEVKLMEKHLKILSGVADTQESIMQLSMDPAITGFDMKEANKLRKSVAKKDKKAQADIKEFFYQKGKELGTSRQLLDYVWNVQISRQLGYSFNLSHIAGYTYIAMQEAELYTYYPHIYWNAAVLSSDAGSDDEEDFADLIEKGWKKKKISKRTEEEQLRQEFMEDFEDELQPDELEDAFKEYLEDYRKEEDKKAVTAKRGQIAFVISNLQTQMNIAAPDINSSGYGFRPDNNNNAIVCGLKIVAKCGNALINEIIKNRPYTSIDDFTSRVKISKDRVCYLIKAGAFRNIDSRDTLTLLKDYVLSVSDQKKKLTLQNMQKLIEYNLLDNSLSEEIKLFNWIKYIRKTKYDGAYYLLDDRAYNYYYNHFDEDNSVIVNNSRAVSISTIDNYYKKSMDKVRNYIAANSEELLSKLNNILFENEWKKYGVKTEAEGEVNSMRIYVHEHPYKSVETQLPISTLDEVYQGEVVGKFNIKGKIIPKMKIHYIMGTVIDKDKMHHMVSILTPNGAIEAKMSKDQFAFYDQTIVEMRNGEKIITQPSFFEVGTNLLLTGCINNDLFKLKKYKDSLTDDVLMRVVLTEDNHVMADYKIGTRDE